MNKEIKKEQIEEIRQRIFSYLEAIKFLERNHCYSAVEELEEEIKSLDLRLEELEEEYNEK